MEKPKTKRRVRSMDVKHGHCLITKMKLPKALGYLVDVNGTVKLVDFGLAKFCKLNNIKSFKGTAFRMAPEVCEEMLKPWLKMK
ncbi:mitogen-activated protein kinase kinase kinase 1-like [Vitis riparia]|uniref:mitogen-activated protein kinase kinase kinase 1-like n=1 Tax=Vitis riparia TaxID=96939 RepID=UPI00155B23DD|nr:mitogen-activated protein kinase kinase kinase 1-like [Vitis riparia]